MPNKSIPNPPVDTKLTQSSMNGPNGVGLSNPQLSSGRRQMLDLVNKLHSTGVQVDIDLPQIAVIGSQSAGKSSLIESISGITLPRAQGTCTRCPTECRLSCSDGKWRCVVSLRRLTDAKGQVLGQVINELFGPTIFDKSEVEGRIRRAQLAILNPSKLAKYYIDCDEDSYGDSELTFSNNCVSLQISGPDVADLSFCDLPGLIASVGRDGKQNDIELVKSLVTAYIKKSSCIILLTVACETDFENQGAHRLAKEYDPHGKRTIGVLTKPDRIPAGEEQGWLPFIRNEKEPLENNWYCVKQPNSNDIKKGITWKQARSQEDKFFSMTAPWSELDSAYQRYLRTSNLIERLSSILSELISKRLPQIQDELEASILKTREALDLLPKEPSKDPLSDIVSLLHTFTVDLEKHLEGVPDEDGLIQAIRPTHETFRKAVKMTEPKYRPFERKNAPEGSVERAFFLSDEGDEVGIKSDSETPGSDVIYIDDVFHRAHRARTRELPGNYPFVVQKTFIDGFIKNWRVPVQVLCKAISAIMSEFIKSLVHKHFHGFGQGNLEQRVRVLLQDQLKHSFARAEERTNWLFELENRPFSLNNHYFADYKQKFLAHYKGLRESKNSVLTSAINSYSPPTRKNGYNTEISPINKVLSSLTEIGIIGVKPEDMSKLLPHDKYEPALYIMADVRAYFQVAYKRFTDNIPLAIDHELILGFKRNMLKTLYIGLGIQGLDGHRICKELAMESPRIAVRREELLKKLERLDVASSQLLQIGL